MKKAKAPTLKTMTSEMLVVGILMAMDYGKPDKAQALAEELAKRGNAGEDIQSIMDKIVR